MHECFDRPRAVFWEPNSTDAEGFVKGGRGRLAALRHGYGELLRSLHNLKQSLSGERAQATARLIHGAGK